MDDLDFNDIMFENENIGVEVKGTRESSGNEEREKEDDIRDGEVGGKNIMENIELHESIEGGDIEIKEEDESSDFAGSFRIELDTVVSPTIKSKVSD